MCHECTSSGSCADVATGTWAAGGHTSLGSSVFFAVYSKQREQREVEEVTVADVLGTSSGSDHDMFWGHLQEVTMTCFGDIFRK